MRTPLARVKGLGSAHSGNEHFWLQRLSSLALIPLLLWFCFAIARLPSLGYAELVSWMQSPFSALMMILFVVTGLWHGKLGLQVVIEDYVSDHSVRTGLLIANTLLSVLLIVAGVFGVLKLSIGGGVL